MHEFDKSHAATDEASIVNVTRTGRYVSSRLLSSRILCPSHTHDAMADYGAEGILTVAHDLVGTFVCSECAKFDYNAHAKLVEALKVPGAYTRQRGYNGQMGIVYNSDPSSPSGARASGAHFDPFCPHAMQTVEAVAKRMEPPRR